MSRRPVKRGRGRPSLSGETGERFQVTIPPTVATKLRGHGDGSLSQGIIRAAKKLRLEEAEQRGYINGLQFAGNLKARIPRDANGSNVLNDIRAQIDAEIQRAADSGSLTKGK
jgi:hypothetical protein